MSLMWANLFKCHDDSRTEHVFFPSQMLRFQQAWIHSSKFITDKQRMNYGNLIEYCVSVRVHTRQKWKEKNVDEACFVVFWWKINEPKSLWYHELFYDISNIWFDALFTTEAVSEIVQTWCLFSFFNVQSLFRNLNTSPRMLNQYFHEIFDLLLLRRQNIDGKWVHPITRDSIDEKSKAKHKIFQENFIIKKNDFQIDFHHNVLLLLLFTIIGWPSSCICLSF